MDTLRLLSRASGLKLNQADQSRNQPLPSAGGNIVSPEQDQEKSNSKKRKRDQFDNDTRAVKDLDEAEIRKIQNQHKIKITDLRALRKDKSKTRLEPDAPGRKASKEAAKIFPQPLQKFSQLRQLGVNRALIANLAQQAYREPTEVQLATIPLLLRADDEEPDLLTVAPTGSGKTLAFLIPLIEKISRAHHHDEDTRERHVSALILAPTKELAGQTVNEGRKLAGNTGVRITGMRKGMRLFDELEVTNVDDLEGDDSDEEHDTKGTVVKADVLVATPLSLVNAITNRKTLDIMPLPHIRSLILDEADYLLDTLFRKQVLSIWSACTSSALRTSLWSATIGSSIEELAVTTITSRFPARSKQPQSLLRTIIGLKDTSLPTINHKLVYASTEPGKLMGLRQLLHPAPSSTNGSTSTSPALRPPFLIFTQTIPRATALHTELKYDIPASAGGSSRIAVLHSNLSSTQRATTMTDFRQSKIWILITTDLLSRGVDFRGINGVVNYDIPTTAASYVHRAGRTGRAGREGGVCVTFYTREDIKYLKPIANLITASEKKNGQRSATDAAGNENGMPSWLLSALPELSKQDRKELKQRGVNVRRAVKDSDDKEERRKKGKNRIGTSSGYERRLENRKKEMVEGSKRRKQKEIEQENDSASEDDGFQGFDD